MVKAEVAGVLLRANAFAPFRFLNRNKLLILMYHRFSVQEEFGKTSQRTFEAHLTYLTRNYRVLRISDAVDMLRNGEPIPPRSAVITIDDGYRDFYDVAFPILRKFAVAATIFIVTDFVDKKGWIWTDKARYILNETKKERLEFVIGSKVFEQRLRDAGSRLLAASALNAELKSLFDDEKEKMLRDLARSLNVEIPELPQKEFSAMSWKEGRELVDGGVEVGSHTVSHPILTSVDADRLSRELTASKTAIEERLQREASHFCYPNGDVTDRERRAAEAAGYASAVTTDVKLCGVDADRFLIPRIGAEPEMHRFAQSTSGFDELKKWRRPFAGQAAG